MTVRDDKPGESDGLLAPRRHVATAGLILAMAAVVVDGIAAAALLPRIAASFGISAATSTSVVIVYQLVIIAAMLPFAAFSQIVGYRKVYLAGLTLFAVMGCVSALSPLFGVLLAARAVQGLAAACVMSVNLALMRNVVPSRLLGRTIGINAMCVALATSAGPALAGLVIALGSWHAMFLLSAVLVIGPAVIGFLHLPESVRAARRFDLGGAMLSAATFVSLLLALNGVAHDWPIALVGLLAALGPAAAILLVRHVRADPSPMLPIDLLRHRVIGLSLATSICAFGVQMLIFVSLPFYLQEELALTPLASGLVFSAWPFALAVVAPVAGILADRYHPGPLGFAGLGLIALGLCALITLSAFGGETTGGRWSA